MGVELIVSRIFASSKIVFLKANLQDLCIPLRRRVVPFGAFVDVGAMAPPRSIRWKSGKGGTEVFSVPTIFSPYNHHAWMMLECVFLLASS